jgi:hypothetical protein
MAPNLSGIEAVDQARSVHLADLALEIRAAPTCNPAARWPSKCSREPASTTSSVP